MGADTKIQWAHHTFNPWRGCTKVSAGCLNCYAETLSKRNPKVLGVWGDQGTRVVAAEAYWKQPERWNREAGKAAHEAEMARARGDGNHPPARPRVFCASLADVFEDRPDLDAPRARLFDVMARTPYLDWLLLTKRPEQVMRLVSRVATGSFGYEAGRVMARLWCDGFPLSYIWVGTTTEDQEMAEKRVPELLRIPASVRFLSIEPMIGRVSLDLPRCEIHNRDHVVASRGEAVCGECSANGYSGQLDNGCWLDACASVVQPGINWVIVGGESGPATARPMARGWVRSVVLDCEDAGVPVFVKQFGRNPVYDTTGDGDFSFDTNIKDPKGGVMEEWPEDLRVRQLPAPRDGGAS